MRLARAVKSSAEQDRNLRIHSKRKRIEARIQIRARIILMAAQGISGKDIAEELDTDRRVATRWRARFLAAGVPSLMTDATNPGRPCPARTDANVKKVARTTVEHTPKGATRWSTRI